MDKKEKKRLDVLQQKIAKLQQLLTGSPTTPPRCRGWRRNSPPPTPSWRCSRRLDREAPPKIDGLADGC